MITILKLKVGDAVRSAFSILDTVVRFDRDHVVIRWENQDAERRYTDAELRSVVKVSPFDAEDTRPE